MQKPGGYRDEASITTSARTLYVACGVYGASEMLQTTIKFEAVTLERRLGILR
jgi:hypothetical protein